MAYAAKYIKPKKRERHGMEATPEYRAWKSMKRRCTNPNTPDYPYYGGRGIGVCDEWFHSFLAFYEELGDRPTNKHTLDRVDPNKDYEPGNCKWSTRREQSINQRMRRNNKTGYKCVYPAGDRWQAKTSDRGKNVYLGHYDTPEEAYKAYQEFAEARDANLI